MERNKLTDDQILNGKMAFHYFLHQENKKKNEKINEDGDLKLNEDDVDFYNKAIGTGQ